MLEEYVEELEHMCNVEMPRWAYTYEEWGKYVHRRQQLKQLVKSTIKKLSEL